MSDQQGSTISRVQGGTGTLFDVYRAAGGGGWGVIEDGNDEEVALYLRRAPGGDLPGLRPVSPPPVQSPPPQPAPTPGEPPAPMFSAPPPQPPPPTRTNQSNGLVDPFESVRTFAALLADSLDTRAADLIDPETGLFQPRIMGMMEKTRREIIDQASKDNTITVQALIYDNPLNDSVRVWFAELIKYRVLRESGGGAFPGMIYERRTLGRDSASASFTGGYRLSTNHRVRRVNLNAWRVILDKFQNVYWVPNPLIRQYQVVHLEAVARLARLSRLPNAPALERAARLAEAGSGNGDAFESEAEAVLEKQSPFGFAGDSDADSEAMMPIGAGMSQDVVQARLMNLIARNRKAVEEVRRTMPYVLMPGFQS